MKTYTVTWDIELDADNPIEAAREALKIQRDESSWATAFSVVDNDDQSGMWHVDVGDEAACTELLEAFNDTQG